MKNWFGFVAAALSICAMPSLAAFSESNFNYGAMWEGIKDRSDRASLGLSHVAMYIGDANTQWSDRVNQPYNPYWEADMVKFCAQNDITPVFYAYVIAEWDKHLGYSDCDVGSPNHCTNGAATIRRDWNTILWRYGELAKGVASDMGSKKNTIPSIWLIEPDFYQYSVSGDNQRGGQQSGGGIPDADLAGTKFNQIVAAIKQHLPNAKIAVDISPWISNPQGWYSNFDASKIDYMFTSGGRTEGNNTKIRSENNMTWAQASGFLGKKIIADDGYGVGGGAEENYSDWQNVNNLKSRISDGVVGLTIKSPSASFMNWTKQNPLSISSGNSGNSSSSSARSSSSSAKSSSSQWQGGISSPWQGGISSPWLPSVSSSSVAYSSSATVSSSSAVTGNCIAYVAGAGEYDKHCYNSGLTGMAVGKCYTLNPERSPSPQWINNNVAETYWWVETSCGDAVSNTPVVTVFTPAATNTTQNVVAGQAITPIVYNFENVKSVSVAGLPKGLSGAIDNNAKTFTISGTVDAALTDHDYEYTVTVTGVDENTTATGTIKVAHKPVVTVFNPATANTTQEVVAGQAIAPIVYNFENVTNVSVTGLPKGLNAVLNEKSRTYTISGTVDATLTDHDYAYTVTVTGVDENTTATGTIKVAHKPVVTVFNPAAANTTQEVVAGQAIAPIVYNFENVTNVSVAGLPKGLSGAIDNNAKTFTISGTVDAALTDHDYEYTVTVTGVDENTTATGTIKVAHKPVVTVFTPAAANTTQEVVAGQAITPIVYHFENVKGVSVAGLPKGLSGAIDNNAKTFTISGTVDAALTDYDYEYTVTVTGVDENTTATGTIKVAHKPVVTVFNPAAANTTQEVVAGQAITPIVYNFENVKGVSVAGLPKGLSGAIDNNAKTFTISGTVDAALTDHDYEYTVTVTGVDENTAASGTIKVAHKPVVTVFNPAAANTTQEVVAGQAITPIVYNFENVTNVSVAGLPKGLSAVLNERAKTYTISGTVDAELGTHDYEYAVTVIGVDENKSATGVIHVTRAPVVTTVALTSNNADQNVVAGQAIDPIVFRYENVTEISVDGLPLGLSGSVDQLAGTYVIKGIVDEKLSTHDYDYTVTFFGVDENKTATGSIKVLELEISSSSEIPPQSSSSEEPELSSSSIEVSSSSVDEISSSSEEPELSSSSIEVSSSSVDEISSSSEEPIVSSSSEEANLSSSSEEYVSSSSEVPEFSSSSEIPPQSSSSEEPELSSSSIEVSSSSVDEISSSSEEPAVSSSSVQPQSSSSEEPELSSSSIEVSSSSVDEISSSSEAPEVSSSSVQPQSSSSEEPELSSSSIEVSSSSVDEISSSSEAPEVSSSSVQPPQSSSSEEPELSSSSIEVSSSSVDEISSSSEAPEVSSSSEEANLSSSSEEYVSSSSEVPEISSSSEIPPQSSSSVEPVVSSSSVQPPQSSSSEEPADSSSSSEDDGTELVVANRTSFNIGFARNVLTLASSRTATYKIQIFDMMGHAVASQKEDVSGSFSMNLDHLNRGNYLVRISSGSEVRTSRIAIR